MKRLFTRFLRALSHEKIKKLKSDSLTDSEFRNIVDTGPAVIWITNLDSSSIYLSKNWYRYTGRTPEQDLKFGWLENMHPDDVEQATRIFKAASAIHVAYNIDYRLRRFDGQYRWVVGSGTPRFDGTGNFLGYIGTVTDVHERKLAEEEKTEALRVRDEFLSVASHELKTPITSLQLQLQMAQKKIDQTVSSEETVSKLKQVIHVSTSQVQRLSKLVDDLLDVSRIQSGYLHFKFEEFNVTHFIEEVTAQFQDQLQIANCNLTLDIDPQLQACWDRSRMEQVLINLLTNAMKYAPGSPLKITARNLGSWVQISVQDFGPGISSIDRQKIFERFERLADHKNITGLGLGLFIVKQIVRGHSGTIDVESKEKEWTKFNLRLPRRISTRENRIEMH